MASFKDHKVTVNHLLGVIPEGLLSQLSDQTQIDYYAKTLHGRKMFYLLLYGILENDRLSPRTLEDTFNDSIFKTLFALDPQESMRRSSISERLGKIDSGYFRQIYECIYEQFSECYSNCERQKYNLIRVDSTIVYDVSNRLVEGFNHNQHPNKVAKCASLHRATCQQQTRTNTPSGGIGRGAVSVDSRPTQRRSEQTVLVYNQQL